MENFDEDKCKLSSRIPSPSSVSSNHSVKPLEWDSGADIGYRYKMPSNLSTVERIALARGTVNLLETCQSRNSTEVFKAPLAHSSPLIAATDTFSGKDGYFKENEFNRLVDYSICSNETIDSLNMSAKTTHKSLDDIRCSDHKSNNLSVFKSYSASNIFVGQKSNGHLSSSSVTTILSKRKCLHKAVQVNEQSLRTSSSCKSHSSNTNNTSPSTKSFNNLKFIAENDAYQSRNLSDHSSGEGNGNCAPYQSNSGSSDKGSFEYVPGSAFDIEKQSRSSANFNSDTSTLHSEINEGVELVTRYVNDLHISNKRKLIFKMARRLLDNVNSVNLKETRTKLNCQVDLFENDSKESDDQSICRSVALQDHGVPSRSIDSESNDGLIICSQTTDHCRPSKTDTSTTTEQCHSGLKTKKDKDSNSSANLYSLKQFLEKERETQLLWIKSGIDHLTNLKRLYESQKKLKKNLHSLKKNQPVETFSFIRKKSDQIQSQPAQLRSQSSNSVIRRQFCSDFETSSNTSTSRRSRENVVSKITSTVPNQCLPRPRGKTKISKTCRSIQCNYCSKICKCLSDGDENKENISTNQLRPKSTDIRSKSKTSVSYTVLFDKKPSLFIAEDYMIKKETIRKCVRNENSKLNSLRRKKCRAHLSAKSDPTLQDYLMQNKPEYINKAECRRQCLEEIAKLRQLRDKSRAELVNALHNEVEKLQCDVPPPLSVLRIFDDKSMKQRTAKKYQQLPEVRNKKLELKRKESYHQNQIMAKLFAKRLQRKVLRGQVNLSNGASVVPL